MSQIAERNWSRGDPSCQTQKEWKYQYQKSNAHEIPKAVFMRIRMATPTMLHANRIKVLGVTTQYMTPKMDNKCQTMLHKRGRSPTSPQMMLLVDWSPPDPE